MLVTHHVQFAAHCDLILMLGSGGVVDDLGTYESLIAKGHTFKSAEIGTADDAGSINSDDDGSLCTSPTGPVSDTTETADLTKKPVAALVQAEERAAGGVTGHTYLALCRAAGGVPVVVGLLLFFAATQGLGIVVDWWLAKWVDSSDRSSTNNLLTYGLLVLGYVAAAMFRSFIYMKVMAVISSSLHAKAFAALIRTPVRFFDTNPVGRILNRFSKDLVRL